MRDIRRRACVAKHQTPEGKMLTRDEVIRDVRNRAGTFPAVLVVYGILVATLIGTGMAIV